MDLDRQRLMPRRIRPSEERQKKVRRRAATAAAAVCLVFLSVDYGPRPRLPAYECCRPRYHDNQVKIDLISALHLCTGSSRERTASSCPPFSPAEAGPWTPGL
ncbi:Hypothetical predicted protein [Xyrichtys novacula]|uniref:Uncharacterized protein n=1 Tax=Xyrichtys novacula TaxID=13765 RepID=A0AAV1H1A0_XYRNO|nr:Hypothetical predicted protein [Xyrichtys novacula]